MFAWTGPSQSPPAGNTDAPIDVGTASQIKNGNIGVNGLAVFGNAVLAGTNSYLNFGASSGSNGYGVRDNNGTLEFKNSGGSWSSIQSTVFNLMGSGASSWAANGTNMYNTNTGGIGINTSNPQAKLDVNGSTLLEGGLTTYGTAQSQYGASPEIYANGDNHTGGGIAISDDGGFYDYNDGPVTFNGSTGLKIAGNNGPTSFGTLFTNTIYVKNTWGAGDQLGLNGNQIWNTQTGAALYLQWGNPSGSVIIGGQNGSTNGLQVFGSGSFRDNLGTRGMDPYSGLPSGWGGGVHTLDVYAEGTVGAGQNGSLTAYLNSAGRGYFSNGVQFGDGTIQTTAAGANWTTSGSNIYYNGGNVGVGTASPSDTFDVAGNVRFDYGGMSGGMLFTRGSGDGATLSTYNQRINTWNGLGFGSTCGTSVGCPDNTNAKIVMDLRNGNLTAAGMLQSNSGGIKFPDGTVQTTAANNQWGAISNTGGGSWASGSAAWGGNAPATTNTDSSTGILYSGGTGSQLFTLGSGPGQTSLQLDGSIFAGDSITYNPRGVTGSTGGSLLVENSAAVGGTLDVQGSATFNTGPYTNDWFRINGNNGVYWQTWGGGFLMYDSYWIRTYNNNGIWAGTGNIGTNGGLTIGYSGSGAPSGGAIFAGNVGIGTNNPTSPLTVNGVIQTTSGGVKFPDGTVQKTAAGQVAVYSSTSGSWYVGPNNYYYSDATVSCPTGSIATGGGGYCDEVKSGPASLFSSHPIDTKTYAASCLSDPVILQFNVKTPTGLAYDYENPGGNGATAYIYCMSQ